MASTAGLNNNFESTPKNEKYHQKKHFWFCEFFGVDSILNCEG